MCLEGRTTRYATVQLQVVRYAKMDNTALSLWRLSTNRCFWRIAPSSHTGNDA
jgi:hypothetical protein